MKKSVSLKEFSTTPTVSCMLRKDGTNEGSGTDGGAMETNSSRQRAPLIVPPPTSFEAKKGTPQNTTGADSDLMFEME
jgi:hypothetical protein